MNRARLQDLWTTIIAFSNASIARRFSTSTIAKCRRTVFWQGGNVMLDEKELLLDEGTNNDSLPAQELLHFFPGATEQVAFSQGTLSCCIVSLEPLFLCAKLD